MSKSERTLRVEDSTSKAIDILGSQLGTDAEMLAEAKTDIRRLTKIDIIEVLWLSYFLNYPKQYDGGLMEDFCDDYMNLKTSETPDYRVKLIVEALKSLSGKEAKEDKAKDKRSWIQRNITQRGKEVE